MIPDALLDACLQAGVVVVLGLALAVLSPRDFRWRWLLAAAALIVLHDALLVRVYGLIPELVAGRWNWTGKWLATIGMLAVAALPAFGWRRSGVTLRQSRGSGVAWLVVLVLTVGLLVAGFHFGDGPADAGTIAFQWTMPGIEEELFYRGVLLLALNEAFRARWRVFGAGIGWGGLLSTVAFGLIHAMAYRDGAVSFDAAAFLMTGGPAVLLLWLRERTGSLLAPVLAHNVVNGAFVIF